MQKLEKEKIVEFDLIEETSEIAIKRKQRCDLFIDQIGDRGGWGYGMNLESLSMGICLTELNSQYENLCKIIL